jgi:UDP-N-acetyl-D-mannosaminuronate dehydrogenase
MPLVTLDKVDELLGGLEGKKILLLGVSYREGVADTRDSPSRIFLEGAGSRGAEVVPHDPLVRGWGSHHTIAPQIPSPDEFDAVVFAVPHAEYGAMDVESWLGSARPLIVDANDVLKTAQLRRLAAEGFRVWSIGRGQVSA